MMKELRPEARFRPSLILRLIMITLTLSASESVEEVVDEDQASVPETVFAHHLRPAQLLSTSGSFQFSAPPLSSPKAKMSSSSERDSKLIESSDRRPEKKHGDPSDGGEPARCRQVVSHQGLSPGLLQCTPQQKICYPSACPKCTRPNQQVYFESNGQISYRTGICQEPVERLNQEHYHNYCPKGTCLHNWGGQKVECPDGISVKGFYVHGNGPYKYCVKWSARAALSQNHGAMNSCDGPSGVCTKAEVTHGLTMTEQSGIFVLKRMRCNKNKCAVFKVGLCIDVGVKVFIKTNRKNNALDMGLGGYISADEEVAERYRFAILAEQILTKYPNKLPSKHVCSDTRYATSRILDLRKRGYKAAEDATASANIIRAF